MVFRLGPLLPAHAMKTYQLVSPGRPATCAQVGCGSYANGWTTTVDEATELGQAQAHWIRTEARRSFTERRTPAGLTEFTFAPGQACFRAHTLPWEGRERFLVRGGDWRGNPRGEHREHVRPEDWVEDFAEHQQALADRLKEG